MSQAQFERLAQLIQQREYQLKCSQHSGEDIYQICTYSQSKQLIYKLSCTECAFQIQSTRDKEAQFSQYPLPFWDSVTSEILKETLLEELRQKSNNQSESIMFLERLVGQEVEELQNIIQFLNTACSQLNEYLAKIQHEANVIPTQNIILFKALQEFESAFTTETVQNKLYDLAKFQDSESGASGSGSFVSGFQFKDEMLDVQNDIFYQDHFLNFQQFIKRTEELRSSIFSIMNHELNFDFPQYIYNNKQNESLAKSLNEKIRIYEDNQEIMKQKYEELFQQDIVKSAVNPLNQNQSALMAQSCLYDVKLNIDKEEQSLPLFNESFQQDSQIQGYANKYIFCLTFLDEKNLAILHQGSDNILMIDIYDVETKVANIQFKMGWKACNRQHNISKFDSDQIAAGFYNQFKILNYISGEVIRTFNHPGYLDSLLCFNKEFIITADNTSSRLFQWNVRKTDQPLTRYFAHTALVYQILQIDQQYFATCSRDITVQIWDINHHTHYVRMITCNNCSLMSICLSSSRQYLYAGTDDGNIFQICLDLKQQQEQLKNQSIIKQVYFDRGSIFQIIGLGENFIFIATGWGGAQMVSFIDGKIYDIGGNKSSGCSYSISMIDRQNETLIAYSDNYRDLTLLKGPGFSCEEIEQYHFKIKVERPNLLGSQSAPFLQNNSLLGISKLEENKSGLVGGVGGGVDTTIQNIENSKSQMMESLLKPSFAKSKEEKQSVTPITEDNQEPIQTSTEPPKEEVKSQRISISGEPSDLNQKAPENSEGSKAAQVKIQAEIVQANTDIVDHQPQILGTAPPNPEISNKQEPIVINHQPVEDQQIPHVDKSDEVTHPPSIQEQQIENHPPSQEIHENGQIMEPNSNPVVVGGSQTFQQQTSVLKPKQEIIHNDKENSSNSGHKDDQIIPNNQDIIQENKIQEEQIVENTNPDYSKISEIPKENPTNESEQTMSPQINETVQNEEAKPPEAPAS